MVKIEEGIDLKKYNTYGVGGKAKYFVLAKEKQDLIDAYKFSIEKNIPYTIIGWGSNVLMPDDGYNGLVVVNKTNKIEKNEELVKASSGLSLARLIKFAIDEGLSGLESLAGIPGTLGGATIGNAGSFGGEIADTVESVEIISDEGDIQNIDKNDLDFKYRDSQFKHGLDGVILNATLKLEKSTSEEVKKKTTSILEKRSQLNQPGGRSCGSFFKNIKVTDAPESLLQNVETRGLDGNIPAGKLIDLAGCKGMKVGDAEVSLQNGNFIINLGDASSKNIKQLAEQIEKKVYEKFDVKLEPEVRYL